MVLKPSVVVLAVLAAFVVIDAALIISLNNIEWEYHAYLPLLVITFGVVAGQTACLAGVCALQEGSLWRRAGSFALVLAVAGTIAALINPDANLIVPLAMVADPMVREMIFLGGEANIIVTLALVAFCFFATLRLTGWRLVLGENGLSWQFSLAELLWLTAGAALLLALQRWGGFTESLGVRPLVNVLGRGWLQPWLPFAVFASGVLGTIAYGMVAQRVWTLVGMALMAVPIAVFLTFATVSPHATVISLVHTVAGGVIVLFVLAIRGSGLSVARSDEVCRVVRPE